MDELIDITIYLGSEENPIIARLGITKKAESYALDMIVYFGLIGFFVKFGAGYPELESTTFRLNSSN
ncbi:MAG: hypothetical protein PHE29_08505, partial [Tissierellia bacterium]|nr:hypothetical protein [Tissierellia bacterium]